MKHSRAVRIVFVVLVLALVLALAAPAFADPGNGKGIYKMRKCMRPAGRHNRHCVVFEPYAPHVRLVPGLGG